MRKCDFGILASVVRGHAARARVIILVLGPAGPRYLWAWDFRGDVLNITHTRVGLVAAVALVMHDSPTPLRHVAGWHSWPKPLDEGAQTLLGPAQHWQAQK